MEEHAWGAIISRALRGSWRWRVESPAASAAELAAMAPFLLRSGAGGLLWSIAQPLLKAWAPPEEWRQAFRLHQLQAALHEHNITGLVSYLTNAGVQPLLTKGWSVARLYAEPALRPYGDIDLSVAAPQFSAAQAALERADGEFGPIDLHCCVPELPDRSWESLWRRRQMIPLGSSFVPVLGPEDQLRHQCLHLLRHGAWRPLWLCDLAVLLEQLSPGFVWDYCLSGKRRLTEWTLAAIGLAHRVFGSRTNERKIDERAERPSNWLTPVVLKQWGRGAIGDSHSRDERPLLSYLRDPRGIVKALASRWPNAIEASIKMGGSPRGCLPNCVYQFLATSNRLSGLAARLAKALSRPPRPLVTSLSIHSLKLR